MRASALLVHMYETVSCCTHDALCHSSFGGSRQEGILQRGATYKTIAGLVQGERTRRPKSAVTSKTANRAVGPVQGGHRPTPDAALASLGLEVRWACACVDAAEKLGSPSSRRLRLSTCWWTWLPPRGWLQMGPTLILSLWGAQNRHGRRSYVRLRHVCRCRLPKKSARPKGQPPPITQAGVLHEFRHKLVLDSGLLCTCSPGSSYGCPKVASFSSRPYS